MALGSRPPMSTRSGSSRSWTAVPSARNSGLESTEKDTLLLLARSTASMDSAVFGGHRGLLYDDLVAVMGVLGRGRYAPRDSSQLRTSAAALCRHLVVWWAC